MKLLLFCMLVTIGEPFLFKLSEKFSKVRLYAEINNDGVQMRVMDELAIDEDARQTEWKKRKRKENICKSMPRSQKWFKAKQQHVSPNQKRLYNEHWPTYGINLKYGSKLIPSEVFSNISASAATPVVLDIGFGTGDSIIGMSQQNEDKIYLGCEIHRAGISIVLGNVSSLGIKNVRLIRADITMLLETYLTDTCLDEVCIFFPDPWPNTERDGERRVVRKGDILNQHFYRRSTLPLDLPPLNLSLSNSTTSINFPAI